MIPTTKAKQREFLDALIYAIGYKAMPRKDILAQLRVLRRHLRNRKPVKRGDVKAQPVTPAVRKKIWSMYRLMPGITNQTIANRLNLNGGRVSEVLAGKRY